jgi:DnaJ-domain-containing protein 1
MKTLRNGKLEPATVIGPLGTCGKIQQNEHLLKKKRKAGSTAATAEGYSIFGEGKIADQTEAPRRRSLSKLQLKALNDLGLDDTATKADVRKRYTQLVKQLHPDTNQGKRNTEESYQRVVSAMKVLRTTSLG